MMHRSFWSNPNRIIGGAEKKPNRGSSDKSGSNFSAHLNHHQDFGIKSYSSSSSNYRCLNGVLGEGNTASVILATRKRDGKLVAIKKFKNCGDGNKFHKTNVLAEFYIAKGFRHKNIVETWDLFMQDAHWMMVMEHVPQDLFEKVLSRSLSPGDIESCFAQIVDAVKHIHALGFAHRDIKLENILLDDKGTVKIIDFGTVSVGKSLPTKQVGSGPYMAPELFKSSQHDPQATDVWSVAVVYACMVLHTFPWASATSCNAKFCAFLKSENLDTTGLCTSHIKEMEHGNSHHKEQDVSRSWLSLLVAPSYRSILRSMLQVDPNRRISISQVSRELEKARGGKLLDTRVLVQISEVDGNE